MNLLSVTSLNLMATSSTSIYSDPRALLEHLEPVLGQNGSLKNAQEAQKLVSVMKGAELLVSRCVILCVLKATRGPSTLDKFMEVGGWQVLNVWLAEAKRSQNVSLLAEILQVLHKLPVTILALKQGSMGKLIKQLTKQEDPEVRMLATDILSKWMAIFREGQAAKGVKPSSSEESGKTSSAVLSKDKKEKPSDKKSKKDSKSKAGAIPPVEASQPPPDLVALGKPKDKLLKRPRDLSLQKGQQVPPEKRPKSLMTADAKSKGPVESEGFMNFLSSQAAKIKEKRVKKANKPPSLSKLKGTNGDGGKGLGGGGNTPTSPETPEAGSEDGQAQEEAMEAEDPGPMTKKKRVSWAEEDSLCIIHYFEMDESERANVSHKSFLAAAQNEKLRERQALEAGLMFARDRLIEMIPWRKPPVTEGTIQLISSGADSKERVIQREREEKVLAQLFLSKASLPPTPLEPDPESVEEVTEPKLIPLIEPNAPPEMHAETAPGPSGFTSPSHKGPGPIPPDSPLLSPGAKMHQAPANFYPHNHLTGMANAPPHGPPSHPPPHLPPPHHMQYPGRDLMPPHVPHPQGGGANYYNVNNNFDQQGFPPRPPGPNLGHQDEWGGGGGYYGDQYYHGRGAPGLRHGIRGGFRLRGRGYIKRGGAPGVDSRICKHFLTHGCKLGPRCKFLHCTPEELANQMSEADHGHGRGGLIPPPFPLHLQRPTAPVFPPSLAPATPTTPTDIEQSTDGGSASHEPEPVKQGQTESMDTSVSLNHTT